MMLSIINRNGRILYGGDSVMAATFAWSMCAPMGKRWSVDAILAKNKVEHNDKSLYGFGFLLQIFIIYVVTAYAKSGDTWTRGSAIYYFLNQDRLATDFAVFIREHAPFWFYKFATWSSLAIEFLIPTCIFFPWKNSYIRVLAIGGIWALHFGIFATTTLKVFSLMMIVLSLSLTPQTVLDIIQDKLLFLKKLSIWRLFPSDIKIFPNVTVVFKPIWFIFLFTLLTWHASRSDELFSKVKLPDSTTLGRLVQYISFEQAWNMFSPDAPYGDYFVVFEATLADGSKIDLNTGLPPVYDKLQHGFVKWDREWEAFTYIGLEDGMIDYSEFRRWVFERLPLYVEQPGLPPVKPKQEVKAIKIVLVQDSTSLPGRSRGKVTIKTVFEARK